MANGMRPTGFAARIGYDESFACGLTITRGGLVGATVVDFIQNAVAERVNQTRLVAVSAVPTPDLALDVQRGSIPGQPGAKDPKAIRDRDSFSSRFVASLAGA